jgi:D-alanine-D-alanine ligase
VRKRKLKVMVLAGGPDRERPVSLVSGRHVVEALRQAGHETLERDIGPANLTALTEWKRWGGDVIFPVLHGSWGEGGSLQRILDRRKLPYVGCRTRAAELCMDKRLTKVALTEHNLPTPPYEILTTQRGARLTLQPPIVIKAINEGSNIDVAICQTHQDARNARRRLSARHAELLVEQFVPGAEMTVGVIDTGRGRPPQALPPIRIVPATAFYDYQAKYNRDDTRYLIDPKQIGLPRQTLDHLRRVAVQAYRALGCRHMSRVDFIVDHQNNPWVLEINTIPGFTDHSLLPKAAGYAGIPMPKLVDRLVRLAFDDRVHP